MEELKKIWKKQRDFNKNFVDFDNLTLEEKQKWTKEYALHLFSEFDEVLREINWKMHRSKSINVERQNLVEELVDVFKYWCSIIQVWDISPEEFINEFDRKSLVVEQRYKQEMQLNLLEDKNIIGIDIDGVIADYPNSFIRFIEKNTGKDLSGFVMKRYALYDDLGAYIGDKELLKELKHKYRVSGEKRYINVIPGAQETIKTLKEKGFTIVLLTARPYKKYPRIFADTIEWLNKNNIIYDAIIWDENKEERILKEFPGMKFMLEDCFENAVKISSSILSLE